MLGPCVARTKPALRHVECKVQLRRCTSMQRARCLAYVHLRMAAVDGLSCAQPSAPARVGVKWFSRVVLRLIYVFVRMSTSVKC